MQRLLLASLLVVGTLVVASRADDEKDKKKKESPSQAAFQAIMQAAIKDFRAATAADDKQKVLKEASDKLIKLARDNPKDPIAIQSLTTVMTMPLQDSSKEGQKAKAFEILKQDYKDSDLLATSIPQLAMSNNKEINDFVKLLADTGTNKKVRAAAVSAMLNSTDSALAENKDEKKGEELKATIEKYRKIAATDLKGMVKDLCVGAKMPELTSKNLDDKEVKLSDYKGKVVVVDVWATWCGPCVAMIPHSKKLVERMKDKPFALVSVSFDAKKETLTEFMKKTEMPWDHWWNGQNGPIGKELDIQFFPTIYVVDAKGLIRYKNVRGEKMDKAVELLVKEAEDGKKAKTE